MRGEKPAEMDWIRDEGGRRRDVKCLRRVQKGGDKLEIYERMNGEERRGQTTKGQDTGRGVRESNV